MLLAAGDIAGCDTSGDEATAALLDAYPGATIATLGDHVYEHGTPAEFANCYDPTWGRHRARTRPAVGDHEYLTEGAAGYFGYFGAAAGEPGRGYYSYNLGSWHIVVLNSSCSFVGCARNTIQERWLKADLAANPAPCTLAYWHRPLFSSGTNHGSSPAMRPMFQALHEFGVDVVLAGHEHNYERFAPMDADGHLDPAAGIRSFVVGTGGRSVYRLGTPLNGSEARDDRTFGLLLLSLHPGRYDWRFLPVGGTGTFTDSGSDVCH